MEQKAGITLKLMGVPFATEIIKYGAHKTTEKDTAFASTSLWCCPGESERPWDALLVKAMFEMRR